MNLKKWFWSERQLFMDWGYFGGKVMHRTFLCSSNMWVVWLFRDIGETSPIQIVETCTHGGNLSPPHLLVPRYLGLVLYWKVVSWHYITIRFCRSIKWLYCISTFKAGKKFDLKNECLFWKVKVWSTVKHLGVNWKNTEISVMFHFLWAQKDWSMKQYYFCNRVVSMSFLAQLGPTTLERPQINT